MKLRDISPFWKLVADALGVITQEELMGNSEFPMKSPIDCE